MNKIEKMAAVDARRWALAEMFYGEGAGTARKLLNAELETKYDRMPGYREAFDSAYNHLDMGKIAGMAIKQRKNADRALKTGKNLRALKNGNLRGLSTGVYVAVGVVYVAHVTGYDKVVAEEAKKAYRKTRREVKYRYARYQGRNVTKIS